MWLWEVPLRRDAGEDGLPVLTGPHVLCQTALPGLHPVVGPKKRASEVYRSKLGVLLDKAAPGQAAEISADESVLGENCHIRPSDMTPVLKPSN